MVLNLPQHILGVMQYPLIRETENPESLAYHVSITHLIVMPLLTCIVHIAVTFDNQIRIATKEVRDVITELILPTELETFQLPISKSLP
ncbi:MAG TPA: hypothetical protein VE863_15910 [Pyrinomonadaceae bacterium]|jgi:hypothetical protein|nr:hypothetical protein [Pyrinomonadaceae bacterium]